MAAKYSAVLTKVNKDRHGSMRGQLFENGVLIATFARASMQGGWVQPITYKFRSDAARARFDDFANALTIEETIEALL
jgi:hypothetical protein